MRCPTRLLLPGLTVLVLAGAAAAAGWESIESLPGRAAETVTVKGKPRIYFRITANAPLTVTVAGPARLRVISRAVRADTGSRPLRRATGSH